ncbi:MAG TPA: hypothetical protein VEA63_01360 [Opitutus sp.]|nr:hypothetical protein [Opitutus sp.]
MDYIAAYNRQSQPFVWAASADLILGKVATYVANWSDRTLIILR